MGIGANIQTTRQVAGLTQEQLAAAVGVSRQTVAKWEAGETSPDLEHAAALADSLGCTVDALVNFDSEGTGLAAPPRGKHLFGSWMAGIDQEAMLRQVACPTVYLKATTRYGDDGVLYAATTDDDAARVRECLADCEYVEIDSGHDIHVEHPDRFTEAIAQVA